MEAFFAEKGAFVEMDGSGLAETRHGTVCMLLQVRDSFAMLQLVLSSHSFS